MKITTYSMMANTYLVTDENTKQGFIVDPGSYYQGLTQKVKEEGTEIKYIILTHGHGDHIGGVEQYRKDFPAAELVAAEAEKDLLADPDANLSTSITGVSVSLTADIWVNEGDTLRVGDMELKFTMTPGHTPGGMCILADKVLFSGDTLFRCSIGRTDLPGGSYDQLTQGVRDRLFVLPDEIRVFPGHMEETSIGFEKENNPFV
jgi:hydroxyacylglutathione hydrolase